MAVSAGIARLDRDLVAAYLRRLGVDCEPKPTTEALARLQRAHLRRVPFENLDIHLGVPIELDARGFAEKIALRDRGGFCYELNGAFASLLAELGFDVELLEARVHSPGGLGGRFGHLCLAVQIGDRRLLVDVGFGRSGSDEPILLEPDVAQADTAGAFVLQHEAEGTLDMLRDGLPEYRVALTGRALADFEPGCRFHQTSPDSPFTRTSVCTLRTAHGRVTLAGTRLIETSSGGQAERELDRSAFARVLATTFGVRLGDAAIDRLMARAAGLAAGAPSSPEAARRLSPG
jgi:N-hydroxyarylamine O-acetyltransferase